MLPFNNKLLPGILYSAGFIVPLLKGKSKKKAVGRVGRAG
jgi:hypothetical protein